MRPNRLENPLKSAKKEPKKIRKIIVLSQENYILKGLERPLKKIRKLQRCLRKLRKEGLIQERENSV